MKIAVDAMGGDNAPDVVVQGAAAAVSELGIDVVLVGNEAAVNTALRPRSRPDCLTIQNCTEVVEMDESPLKGVRQKKDASIRVAFELVARGEADAVVSAGNSGATLAAGLLTVSRMAGVERPGIASIMPGEKGPVVLIDVGANVDCRPSHLVQFGVMASAFATSCLGMVQPRIGLLSIGEEGGKGNEQVRLAHELFMDSGLNFAGNVEGRDILAGEVPIIVCDGFVGNVVLKLSENLAERITRILKAELMGAFLGRMAAFIGKGCFMRFRNKLAYEEYGGAPLLGINGVGIVCHGGSSSKAIKNAIGLAARYVDNRVLEKMASELSALKKENTQ
jgi:glycerol-3-phosphate acyltransferase PlsX